MRGRLGLAAQLALILTLAILVAQAINLAIAIDQRRDRLIDNAVVPAAQRLALVAGEPLLLDRAERREARRSRLEERAIRRLGGREDDRGGNRAERLRRMRPMIDDADPVPARAAPLPVGRRILDDHFARMGIEPLATRAVLLPPRPSRRAESGERRDLMLAAQLGDGRWIHLTVPGPEPLRPLVARMIAQALLIALLVLLPSLWLLHRAGGSLHALTRAARSFDGTRAPAPLPERGPRDIAALTRATNEMQARIAAMVAEKDVMLGAIGHDLRTPLTALRLEAEAVEDAERRAALIDQIHRLHDQFEAILDLARASRALDANRWADSDEVIARLERSYEGRPVTVEKGRGTVFHADERPVHRALVNLVDNGLRYGHSVRVLHRIDQEHVHFIVEDDGPGIDPADAARLVQPFERGDASRNRGTGGHGLGLAIVAAIMRRHGGRIALEAREDGRPGLAARLTFARLSPGEHRLHRSS